MVRSRPLPRSAFTLIELMVVIAVVAMLAALVLEVRDGVRERTQRDRARGELTALSGALERYRAACGDYPRVRAGEDDAVRLWRALEGLDLPDGRRVRAPKPFLEGQGFLLGNPVSLAPLPPEEAPVAAVLLDPWGQPYRYAYRGGRDDPSWRRRGFLLLSTGPSGGEAAERGEREAPAFPADGVLGEDYFGAGNGDDPTHDNLLAQP